jgi:hypothetical protein
MKSRISLREKTLNRKNKNTAIKLIILTLAFVVALVFYGIPVFARFASFLIDLRSTPTLVEVDDETPPPPPVLDNLPIATNQSRIEISGYAQPGHAVVLLINNETKEVLSNREGRFSHTYTLISGENSIQALVKSSSGIESRKTEIQKVLYDDTPPELEITKPEDGEEFYGARQRQMIMQGSTDEGATILVNQRAVIVDNQGNFTFSSTLMDGENTFIIIAEDKAGNKAQEEITVTYHP